jgi:hypothetical protein
LLLQKKNILRALKNKFIIHNIACYLAHCLLHHCRRRRHSLPADPHLAPEDRMILLQDRLSRLFRRFQQRRRQDLQ